VGDRIPAVAYLPPFAGITAHEERISGAIRRRRIGEGLAGAVLRNLLLDMQQANAAERVRLRADRPKISDADLRRLREDDPWELLQQTLREVFKAEIQVDDFRDEYHSYINVEVVKGKVDGYKLTRHHGFNSRDLMVEGSGFLQWLSVYTLATNPGLNLLLFDEPDAHLHPSLQRELLQHLEDLAVKSGKQVLLATHSSEILRAAEPEDILQMRSGGSATYLKTQDQQVALLEGLGSDYSPRIEAVRRSKRIFFFEGSSDIAVLKAFSETLGEPWPKEWVEWPSTPATRTAAASGAPLKKTSDPSWRTASGTETIKRSARWMTSFEIRVRMPAPRLPGFTHASGDVGTSRPTSSGHRPLPTALASPRTRSGRSYRTTSASPSAAPSRTVMRRRPS
jgi:hypothetical protein